MQQRNSSPFYPLPLPEGSDLKEALLLVDIIPAAVLVLRKRLLS